MLRPWNHICKTRSASRRKRNSQPSVTSATESLETRQLLAATPIAGLSDEFDDASTTDQWQRVNDIEGWNADQLNVYDIDATQAGRMVQEPHTTGWYQNYRGPMAFQLVTGDFSFTTQVHITDRDDIGGSDANDVPGDADYSLAGAMIRTPRDFTDALTEWAPGSMADDGTNDGENYIFLSAGYGAGNPDEFAMEVKTTRNSDSQLEVTPLGSDTGVVNVQLSRIGNSVIAMYQLPGQEWQVHRRYSRPDMPETMQVGLVTYSDWEKVSDFDPFTQNSTVLVPGLAGDPTPGEAFNPDLTAGFEYARYATPDVPAALAGADLTDPNAVSDAELLSFLGDNTNVVDDGSNGGENPVDPPVTSGSVIGTVYEDQNGSGTRDSDEPGLPGVTIYADVNRNSVLDDSEPSVTTDASGDFELADLALDLHEIRVVIPSGFETTADVTSVSLSEDAAFATASFGLTEIVVDPPVDPPANPNAPEMGVGMNLGMVNDWSHSWVFRDAFKMARTFTTRSLNTTTWEFAFNGPPAMDDDGWVTSIPADTVNELGETTTYWADSILFAQGGNPAGIYRAEWSGEGEITFGATPVETGTTEDGRSYALLEVAEDQTLHIRSGETNPDDYIRDIQIFMPDHAGQSLEMDNWQPGSDESPFHPLFLERLQPFETIRFMQWQRVNADDRAVLTADDLRPASHANQGSTDRSSYNGVSMEYQVQLVNELGADAWFNMPHQADDSYVRAFAEHVRDNLHEDGVAYVEWSNEVWNFAFGFEANAWVQEQMELPQNAGLGFFDVWAQEARRDFEIWSDVFAGQEDRLVRVAAGQQNNPWLTNQVLESMDGEFDAVSSTSYAGLGGDNLEWITEDTTQDDVIDWVLDNSVQWSLQTQAAHVELAEQYSQELGRDIPFITYEGGSHLDGFGTEYQELIHSVQDNPRFREVYETLLHGMNELGVDMHTQYVFTSQGQPTPWGEFGVLHEMDVPLEDAHEYRALVDFTTGDLDVPTADVSIEATDATAHEAGDSATFTVTRTDEFLYSDLTVNYEVSGTATNGADYETLSGTVVILAGELSAQVVVAPLHDSDVSDDEGNESLVLTLASGDAYTGTGSAEATLLDNVEFTIPDQSMSHTEDSLDITLPSELGGQPVSHTLRILQNLVSDLATDHNLFVSDPNFGFNWSGIHQERWIQGDGGYYFILPTGEFRLWEGSFEDSQLLGMLDTSFYDDPELITLAEPIGVSVTVSGSTLTIDPSSQFSGEFDVELTSMIGDALSTQTFGVSVTNAAPVIGNIADQSLIVGSDQLVIDLAATDDDGDSLEYEVRIAGSLAGQIMAEHDLREAAGVDDYALNWGGQNEKWLQGNNGWYFILPNGTLNDWTGSFENSTQLAAFSTDVYDDPQILLTETAQDLQTEVVDGQLVITTGSQTGMFAIEVIVSDGIESASTSFNVDVTNTAPQLSIADQEATSGVPLEVALPTVDADGQAITYTVEVLGDELSALDNEHGFWSEGNYYDNYLGQGERWIRDADNQWHYLLPNGALHRWGGSFDASPLVAELDNEVYDDPSLLTDPQAVPVSASIEDGVLIITTAEGYVGDVQIRVTASDGFEETSTTFQVTVVADPDDDDFEAVDDVYAEWDLLEV
ncbi:MAG: hypothetical protein ACI92S_002208 [Planctomycetaceae bacterium]|jgi:hypothetical protein